jgi:hypothetical protein
MLKLYREYSCDSEPICAMQYSPLNEQRPRRGAGNILISLLIGGTTTPDDIGIVLVRQMIQFGEFHVR